MFPDDRNCKKTGPVNTISVLEVMEPLRVLAPVYPPFPDELYISKVAS